MPRAVLSRFRSARHDHDHCVERALEAAEALCARRGARLTPIRRRVLELVWQGHRPMAAYDLLEQLRAEQPRAAPPTVYRCLDFLQAHGLVHRIESLNAFLGCPHPERPHRGQFLICSGCHAVAELDDPDIGALVEERARAAGFAAESQTIEVSGRCPACRGEP